MRFGNNFKKSVHEADRKRPSRRFLQENVTILFYNISLCSLFLIYFNITNLSPHISAQTLTHLFLYLHSFNLYTPFLSTNFPLLLSLDYMTHSPIQNPVSLYPHLHYPSLRPDFLYPQFINLPIIPCTSLPSLLFSSLFGTKPLFSTLPPFPLTLPLPPPRTYSYLYSSLVPLYSLVPSLLSLYPILSSLTYLLFLLYTLIPSTIRNYFSYTFRLSYLQSPSHIPLPNQNMIIVAEIESTNKIVTKYN